VGCVSPDLWGELASKGYGEGSKRRIELMDLMQGKSASLNYDLLMRKGELDVCLDKYLLCGGVPRAINDLMATHTVLSKTYDDYVEALKGDLAHWKKDDQLSKEILDEVIKAMGSQLSWNGLSSRLGDSQPTIKKYIWTLEHCFVLTYFHRTISLTRPRAATGKTNKKVFFEDPFLFHCARHWVMPTSSNSPYTQAFEFLADLSNKGRLIENVVANHLIRFMFDQAPSSGFQYNANIFYYLESRRELDFILNVQPSPIPIEVKYRSDLKSYDYDFLLKVAAETKSKGLMISRDLAAITEDVATIPVSMFLFII
jgi:predicted AAA+ superfamily ATPase